MGPERRKLMIETVRNISKEFKKFRHAIASDGEVTKDFLAFPSERFDLNNKLLRGFFVRAISDYVDLLATEEKIRLKRYKDKHLYDTKLPFVAEMVLCLQYYDNQIFDKKFGVVTDKKIRNNILFHNLLERELFSYIRREFRRIPEVEMCAKRVLDLTDMGQYVEGKYNTHDHFEKVVFLHTKHLNKLPKVSKSVDVYVKSCCFGKILKDLTSLVPQPYKNFVHLYLLRISLTAASLFVQFADLVISLKKYNGANQQKIRDYAFLLGIISQLVNDVGDFVPSSFGEKTLAKRPADCFSDLKNGNITLPLVIYLLSLEGKFYIEEFDRITEKVEKHYKNLSIQQEPKGDLLIPKILVEKQLISLEMEHQVLSEIRPFLLQYAIPIGKVWATYARNLIRSDIPAGALLIEVLELAESNRYYIDIEDF